MAADTNQDLLQFVSSFKGGDGLRVEESLGDGYVRLRTSEAERRQAKHDIRCVEDAVIELLRNARDADATRIFVGTAREGDVRTIVMVDDGVGIPKSMHDRVFDARVTSKLDTMRMDRWGVHGRGMALYSIRLNAQNAYVSMSDTGLGTALVVVFDTNTIGERADQSTWPQVSTKKAGQFTIRGPHNIYRTCVEFALEERAACNVYVGSPSEALATMRARMPYADGDRIPIAALPTRPQNAKELAELAERMGIVMSERTAHRIVRGQIAPLVNVAAHVLGPQRAQVSARALDAQRRLDLSSDDEQDFARALRSAFSLLEERYYIALTGDPTIRMTGGKVTVSFDFADQD